MYLWASFLNVCINAVCDSDCNSSCVLLADDFKFFHNIGYVEDCKLLQFDSDAVQSGSVTTTGNWM
jgi:hypothetical protein